MIRVVEDSIFNAKENIICHQVNCESTMGSGLALEMKNRYPVVYNEYLKLCSQYCNENKQLLGICQLVVVNDSRIVANLYGQQFYGRDKKYTNYNALIRGFTRLFLTAKCDIAIPHLIACDRGGANWRKLYNILEILAEDFPYDVVIYKYHP